MQEPKGDYVDLSALSAGKYISHTLGMRKSCAGMKKIGAREIDMTCLSRQVSDVHAAQEG